MAETTRGLEDFHAAMDAMAARVDAATKEIATKAGLLVEAAAKAHMNGRPGPMVRSGTLRRSVNTKVDQQGIGAWQATVAPTTVYGRRIELGFRGTDSLGRHYDQPAYPFLGPGLDDARPKIEQLAHSIWADAMR